MTIEMDNLADQTRDLMDARSIEGGTQDGSTDCSECGGGDGPECSDGPSGDCGACGDCGDCGDGVK